MTSKTNSDIALGDVRSTSADMNYFFTDGFSGTLDEAIGQARAMPDFGPGNGARKELLEFLRCAPAPVSVVDSIFRYRQKLDDVQAEVERLRLDAWIEARGVPAEPGFYTLAYAQKHFPDSFKVRS